MRNLRERRDEILQTNRPLIMTKNNAYQMEKKPIKRKGISDD
jgi:hypothetical protein